MFGLVCSQLNSPPSPGRGPDGYRGLDAGLHPLRIRHPRRVRRHPPPQDEDRHQGTAPGVPGEWRGMEGEWEQSYELEWTKRMTWNGKYI